VPVWSWPSGLLFVAGLRELASDEAKSRTNGSIKPVSVIFDIVLAIWSR
jgi:hypothetical protein